MVFQKSPQKTESFQRLVNVKRETDYEGKVDLQAVVDI